MSRSRPWRILHALALCAVALLSVAVVKSTLMQAAMSLGVETCGQAMSDMPGMSRTAPDRPGKADHRACEFCAAAAHAPVCASVPAPAVPLSVAWVRWKVGPFLGARGPPSIEPRARGPPAPPLTLA